MKKMDINWFEEIKSPQGILLGLSIVVAIVIFVSTVKDGKIQKDIEEGVKKIDTIVAESKTKLERAGENLKTNIELSQENLESIIAANQQLMETNQKLNQSSIQLIKNYKKTVEVLKASNKAKEEALNAKIEAINSKDEIVGQLTGGDSFPRVNLNKGGFYLNVQGIYSIPNLHISIFVIPNCLNIPKEVTIDYIRNNKINADFIIPLFKENYPKLWAGHFPSEISIPDFNKYIPTTDGIMHAFEIYYQSDYKKWKQRIIIVSYKGKWEIANILYEMPFVQRNNINTGEKVVFTKISENFPGHRTNSPTGGILIIFKSFNEMPIDSSKSYYEMIEYNSNNGISDYRFDEL